MFPSGTHIETSTMKSLHNTTGYFLILVCNYFGMPIHGNIVIIFYSKTDTTIVD